MTAVLVLHTGPHDWLPGAFFGMSMFFCLSGYLIGSLVLAEVEGATGFDLGGFWARRVRRLVPALVLVVLGIVVLSHAIDLPRSTRAELLGGLGYVANWVQISIGESYAALFEARSAAVHLWSLAIEEQFYVLFPFLAWMVVRLVPGRMRKAYVIGGGLVVAVGVAVALQTDDQVFGYYATPIRAPEIAMGIVLAGLWPMGRLARSADDRSASSPATRLVGVAALVVTLALWRGASLSDGWVYSGGFAMVAVLSAALLWSARVPGPTTTLLSAAPLTFMGRISYGLYLYHWPVVVLLSPPRVDLAPVPLFVLRVVVSLVLAVASHRYVEQPIRRGTVAPGAPPGAVIGVGLGALALTAVVVWFGVDRGEADGPVREAPAVVAPGTSPPEGTAPPRGEDPGAAEVAVPVLALLGDSLPNWMVRDGGWALDPVQVQLIDGTVEGCDGAEGAPVGRAGTGVVVTVPETCTGWRSQFPPVFAGREVDVAVLAIGTGAVLDRQLDGEFVGPCADRARDWYRADVVARLHLLSAEAEQVVVVLPAWSEAWSGWVNPPDHLARTDCVRGTLRAAVDEAAATPPVRVVDLGEHLCPDGPGSCAPVRTRDGVHIDPDHAPEVLGWLVTASLDAG